MTASIRQRLLAASVSALLLSCSGTISGPGSGSNSNEEGSNASLSNDGGSVGGNPVGQGNGSNGGNTDAGSKTEVCDGLDNDSNGVIDDVDVGGDGVCDCLRIATLGFKGQWGNGDVFNNWLDGKSNNGAVALGGQTLTAQLLSQFQVIVIQDVREGTAGQEGVGKGIGRAYSAAEVTALQNWVNGGGGVMTLIGYGSSSEITNVNRLLAPYGLAYGSTAILPKSGSNTRPVTHWMTHDLTAGVSQVGVDNGYPVSGGTLVAYEATPGNYDVARATTLGAGHVYVWGDEWITYDTEWKNHPEYQLERFWLNALKWLTPANQCQVAIPIIN